MERPGSDPRSRRRYLRTLGGLGAASLVGCLDRGGTTEPTDVDAGEVDAESEDGNATGGDAEGTDGDDIEGETDADPETEGDDNEEEDTDAEPIHEDYETREVSVETPDGDVLGSVTAAVADTQGLRETGLSDTESLPEDRGMLFVHGSVRDLTYWMKDMSFGIDIVFADADGVITGIHHASAPGPNEDGRDQTYEDPGQYVLEVNYRWTEERGVDVGDVLVFDPVE
ncbi:MULTISPECIES: DUF192 domain-containing protein [Haloferacaceae]|uniref:DUF192 domain-containing protein n=1 Tax=Halorubrum glutamatedens TaxID=2707018 RepID=A0ABD5QTL6_9EURY|nr:DUF192 domain-containing protein [Halobellus captivus]